MVDLHPPQLRCRLSTHHQPTGTRGVAHRFELIVKTESTGHAMGVPVDYDGWASTREVIDGLRALANRLERVHGGGDAAPATPTCEVCSGARHIVSPATGLQYVCQACVPPQCDVRISAEDGCLDCGRGPCTLDPEVPRG